MVSATDTSKPTGKTHTIKTVNDLLSLDSAELARLLPDLFGWHSAVREAATLMCVELPKMGAELIWTDDGAVEITAMHAELGDHGTLDLLTGEKVETTKEG